MPRQPRDLRGVSPPRYVEQGPSARASRRWSGKLSIAASLALLIAAAAAFLFLVTNRDNNEPTVPGAAIPTSRPTTAATTAPVVIASPSENATSTPEAFLVFKEISEPSSGGKLTPVSELFRSTSIDVTWNGSGMIILSGCPDHPCDLSPDDQLYVQVTNSEEAEAGLWIAHNDRNRTLPLVITDRFRPGTNTVRVQLWDRRGERRGTATPIYIVIFDSHS